MAKEVDKQIAAVDGDITQAEAQKEEYVPVYQLVGDSKIPVSKAMGPFWKSRWKDCVSLSRRNSYKDRWEECIEYYQNDQGGKSGKRTKLSEVSTGRDTEEMYTTENIVFANTSALVPSTYAKNPDIEITNSKENDEAGDKQAQLYEKLVDTLFQRKSAPGMNIKPKMKRAVVMTTLTNISYIELSYVRKADSSQQAFEELQRLSQELSEAKDKDAIQEIEGRLAALDSKINFLSPSGPRSKFKSPMLVHLDSESDTNDPADCNYIFIGEYIPTSMLRALFGKKNAETDEWMSIYKPTHVLTGERDSQGHDDEINNFSLLDDSGKKEYQDYGCETEEEFNNACRTLCWYLWDKTTRRVYMFNDKDWSWPIWVWDDPYKLTRFFPLFSLSFYTDPDDKFGKSEVMYYLDQQDEINRINNERARMRHWVSSKIFVDKNKVKDATDIENFLTQDTERLVHGVDIPEGGKVSDMFGSIPLPSTQFETLFDTKPLMESINRLSAVTPVMQNVQFKTNTTNDAIDSYQSNTQTRLDEKIDCVEEILGDMGLATIEMCIQFMTKQEVYELLGEDYVVSMGDWSEAQDVRAWNEKFNLTIVGGSTIKPTAKVKKEQAMQLGQVLGQFANAAPMMVIVMLKMLERAFNDSVIIEPKEWEMIIGSVEAQLQRGNTEGGGGQPGQGSSQGATNEQGQPSGANVEMLAQVIDRLPPQAKEFLGAGIAKGVPLKELVLNLTKQAQSQQQPQ